jgi:hypothetical protein
MTPQPPAMPPGTSLSEFAANQGSGYGNPMRLLTSIGVLAYNQIYNRTAPAGVSSANQGHVPPANKALCGLTQSYHGTYQRHKHRFYRGLGPFLFASRSQKALGRRDSEQRVVNPGNASGDPR